MNNNFENPGSTNNIVPSDTQGDYSAYTYHYKFEGKPPKKKKSGQKGLRIFAVVMSIVCVLSMGSLFTVLFMNPAIISGDTGAPAGDDEPGAGDNTALQGDSSGGTSSEAHPENASDKKVTDTAIAIHSGDNESDMSISDVNDKCGPAVVGVVIEYKYYGRTYSGTGSGFIIQKDGYVATNAHVVEDADKITVVTQDGTEYTATLIGMDTITDLAVIKIESDTDFPIVELGDSSAVRVGETVVAIGSPAGIQLAGTVTHGIVSAINRNVELTDDYGRVEKTMTLLQTDATINPGNSGGPLLNLKGEVIGINTLKLSDTYEGIGFAIPSSSAVTIINQLLEKGTATYDPDDSFVAVDETPEMGIINCGEITEAMSRQYDVPVGIMIYMLDNSCSLAKNGLKVGDIITAMNGTSVSTLEELRAERDKVKPRDEATVTVYRDGSTFDITFTMGSSVK